MRVLACRARGWPSGANSDIVAVQLEATSSLPATLVLCEMRKTGLDWSGLYPVLWNPHCVWDVTEGLWLEAKSMK